MKKIPLPHPHDDIEQVVHLLDDREEWAIKAALAANRPLLVRGEPGIGKTQLAYAAAVHLNRPIIRYTVDSTTEPRDLLWTFDAVQRLAEAQVASQIYRDVKDAKELEAKLSVKKFIRPGPLWWAIEWATAKTQLGSSERPPAIPKGWKEANNVVVLIDEIDKADSDLPNGLLEALGSLQFTPQGWNAPITANENSDAPLIVVTTNEERMLPDAFVRRCFVLHIKLPNVLETRGERDFIAYVKERGAAHFPQLEVPDLQRAAEVLVEDRKVALRDKQTQKPGQAEYLDFLRAFAKLKSQGADSEELFKNLKEFVFQKSTGMNQ
ncbi:MAG: MoxR family ATPase [Planctomycetaceae bacterium]